MRRTSNISAGLWRFAAKLTWKCCWRIPADHSGQKKTMAYGPSRRGLVEPGDDLLSTAQREFLEETNFSPHGEFIPLPPLKQKSGKTVHAWAFEADYDVAAFASNTFEIEWPPKSGRRQAFPEIDRIGYFAIATAKIKILPYQRPWLEALEQLLS